METNKKLFSGVYQINLRHGSAAPKFLGWRHLKEPRLNDFMEVNGYHYKLVAFSGIPPTGSVLLVQCAPQEKSKIKAVLT